jgi:hypothetical protein
VKEPGSHDRRGCESHTPCTNVSKSGTLRAPNRSQFAATPSHVHVALFSREHAHDSLSRVNCVASRWGTD